MQLLIGTPHSQQSEVKRRTRCWLTNSLALTWRHAVLIQYPALSVLVSLLETVTEAHDCRDAPGQSLMDVN